MCRPLFRNTLSPHKKLQPKARKAWDDLHTPLCMQWKQRVLTYPVDWMQHHGQKQESARFPACLCSHQA